MSFHEDSDKMLDKYKTIWTMIEDLQSIEMNYLLGYHDTYMETKIRTYSGHVYTNFCSLN